MDRYPVPKVNEHGITVLFEAENPTVDIIFVHGFTGHPERTWTFEHPPERTLPFRKRPAPSSSDVQPPPSKISRTVSSGLQQPARQDRHDPEPPSKPTSAYWPRDLVPTTLPQSRVLTYGYDTNIRTRFGASPVSKKSVADHGWDLLCTLADNRHGVHSRPLIFVAHSLGGLISKVALIKASEDGQHARHAQLQSVAQSTVGVLFFGTPHQGADPFNIAHRMLKRLATVPLQYNDNIARTLLHGGDYLKSTQERFVALSKRTGWAIFSFQEEYAQPGLLGKKVVEDASSCIGDPDLEETRHIGKNHRDMVQFSGDSDPEYQKVAHALRTIQIPSGPHLQRSDFAEDSASPSQEPAPANVPKVDPPVAPEVLAKRRELMELLEFDEIGARLLSLKAPHHKTCAWFLENEKYRQWLDLRNVDDHHGFLWIKGKPGSGKSILMKFLEARTRSAAKDPHHLFASFFFYAPGQQLEKSTLGVYRSLLWQLLQNAPDLQRVLDELDSSAWRVIKKTGWQNEALKRTIRRAIDFLGGRDLSVFIDALDECRDDDVADMVSFFEDLGERAVEKGKRLRICFSSRHYPAIDLQCGLEIVLEEQDEHNEDIARYISSKLRLPKSKQTEGFRDEVLEKSAGIFLWVALVIPMLNKANAGGRVDQLQKCLNAIPMGLDNLFDLILARDDEAMDELRFCVQLILFAVRPVTLTEYYFALRRAGDEDLHDSWAEEHIDGDVMGRFALSSSKGLAEVTKTRKKDKDPTVQFIHESVRDFLFSESGRRRLWPSLNHDEFTGFGHDALKLRCLAEVEVYQSNPHYEYRAPSAEDLTQTWPFLWYATDNLLLHANQAQQCGCSQDEFLLQFSEHQEAWVALHDAFERFTARHYHDNVDVLYILAEHGLDALLKIHPRLSSHMDVRGGGRYFLPLAAAITLKHISATRVLVASMSPDPEFAAGIEHCVMNLARGRHSSLSTMSGFFNLLLHLGHIPLMAHFIEHFMDSFPQEAYQNVIGRPFNWFGAVAFSPDCRMLASTSNISTLHLWDTVTGGHRVLETGGEIRSVVFSPDGQILAVFTPWAVRLWDAATGTLQQVLEGLRGSPNFVAAFSPNGHKLAIVYEGGQAYLWTATTGVFLQTLKGYGLGAYCHAVAFSHDSHMLAVASNQRAIKLWDPAAVKVWDQTARECLRENRKGNGDSAHVTVFSPDGWTLAASSSGEVQLWDVATGALRHTLQGPCARFACLMALSPDGKTLALMSVYNRVQLWDAGTGAFRHTVEGGGDFIRAVAFSLDGRTMVLASSHGAVRFWDLAAGAFRQRLEE